MKIHVISDLSHDTKLNLACGSIIHPLSFFQKRPQPLTRLLSIDLNPEGNCDNESVYVLNFWNDITATGEPDSYLIMDKEGKITQRKETSISFENWTPFEPRVFQVTLKPKRNIMKYIIYATIVLVVLGVLAGLVYAFYRYTRTQRTQGIPKKPIQQKSFFKK